MSRLSMAERARLFLLLGRRALRVTAGRVRGHPLIRWRLLPAQGRPAADRAAGAAHRRQHPRQRNLRRPLRLRRQGGDQRRPLAVRDRAAVRRMGGEPARLRLAAPSARGRIGHHARQCPRAGGRMDFGAGLVAPGRLAAGNPGAAHHLLAQPGAADPVRLRRAVSIAASCAAWCARCATSATPRSRRATACRACRRLIALTYAALCMAGPGAPHARLRSSSWSTSWSARSCRTAATSAATPAR